uniref:Amino acid permease n=1 Tax=Roseihalotalea indica TaxID=2867963 RepID=A0AA49GN32_9BACT|nr:amino acid permease [Tunicatimonas sp. TK19036]
MARSRKFGTFGGVFTPSILTILGVIMYLRLPTIVGQAGLWTTIAIIVIAHVISITTGLSVSSIATDKKVQAGGTYFMISRSLGLPIGGTLGLALFVGLSFSVSLYIIGFSESFLTYWGWDASKDSIRLTGSIALLTVTIITFISTSLALRMQFFIMAAIILSLISIVFGGHSYEPSDPQLTIPTGGVSFMLLFGIFFPAVTGFEAGVSMSGDLKDAKQSIPQGTILAIVVGLVVYIALAFFLTFTVDANALATDNQILLNIAWIPELVIAGIWGATISSALGSILGAPRILQATAADRISPAVFAKGVGATNEPRNALLLTFIIAEAGILIGELDVIARVVSIFFITTYGFLNISAAFEAWTSADFRPEFKIPSWVSLLGALACFIVMIQLDFLAMLGATLILGLLYFYLKRKELALESGDAWSGIWASLVKTGLQRLSSSQLHARNWRPNVLMFSGSTQERPHLVEMGQALTGRLGMLSSFELIPSDKPLLAKASRDLEEHNMGYFSHKYQCKDVYEGMDQISRIYGFTGVEPNTVLMGWSKTPKNRPQFAQLLQSFYRSDYNVVCLSHHPERGYGNHKTIDVWWSGSGRNLAFALNLIRHITAGDLWETAELRIMLILADANQTDLARKATAQLLERYRMNMKVRLIDNSLEQLPYTSVIQRESENTDLTIIGMADPKYRKVERTVEETHTLLQTLGTSLVISAASTFEEINLGLLPTRKTTEETEAEIPLPDLPVARNSWLTRDLERIDERNRQVLTRFYERTFVPYFQESRRVAQEIEKIHNSVFSNLQRDWEEYEDHFRRARALDKAKNDVAFRVRALLENLRDKQLEQQQEVMSAGIDWYTQRLATDIIRFPQKAAVTYQPEALAPSQADDWKVRWRKRQIRLKAWISRQPPARVIDYREVAIYYLRDNRQVFLATMLMAWQEQSTVFLADVKNVVSRLNRQLTYWENHLETLSEEVLDQEIETFLQESPDLEEQQKQWQQRWLRRMQVEFRRNLRQFVRTVEAPDGMYQLQQKRQSASTYERLAENNQAWVEEWFRTVRIQLNTLLLDVFLLATENRVQQEMTDFTDAMSHGITKHYLEPMEELQTELEESLQAGKEEVDVSYESLNGVTFHEDLSGYYEDVAKLVDQLPESIEVQPSLQEDGESGSVNVPVHQLANYWLETTLYQPIQEKVTQADQRLQRCSHTVRDVVRLASLRKTQPGDSPKEDSQLIQDALKVIEQEQAKIRQLQNSLPASIQEHLKASYEKLTTQELVNQAGGMVNVMRVYQSQRVRTQLEQYQNRVHQWVRNIGTRLLYSRSQGILLAKRLTETEDQVQSHTARILSLVEQVSPRADVLRQLPFYYRNLFTGQSDISQDFWVERPYEMELAERAMGRLKNGYAGGIMLLGERNSGKTALSWRIAKKFTRKEDRIFQVYPPVGGSTQLYDFSQALQQATHQSKANDQLMEGLAPGCVFIINDLELWWERSDKGFTVVKEVMRLLAEYGKRHLFLINTNPFAFHLMNQLYSIEDMFLSVIPYQPFSTEDIERLILLRHWSGGLKFVLRQQTEDELSEWKKVQFFNNFFDYSGGNPGAALGAWLASIEKVGNKQVHLRYPKSPDIDALQHMPDDWVVVVMQFLLHKRLSVSRLTRLLQMEYTEVRTLLQDVQRAGLIVEKGGSVFQLNIFMEIHLINFLREQELL